MFAIGAWLCLAVGIGISGIFRNASALSVAASVWILTAMALLGCWKISALHRWWHDVDLPWLILLHVTRFVGFYFLALCRRGELSCAFAQPAGIGDICTAATAVLILAVLSRRLHRTVILIWNTAGLLDILFVVVNALRVGLNDWPSMAPLRELPLSLLPTFLVPLIITSHILIFVRLFERGRIESTSL